MSVKRVINSLDNLVVALCTDYARREEIILGRMAERRVDNELRYINFKMFDAAAEIVGESRAETFIREIGKGIGYANATELYISEGTYKNWKASVKENIAKRLYLK